MPMIQGDNLRKLEGDERLGQYRESEYLGAEDLTPGTEPILTISGLYNGMVKLQRGKENKDVITFFEKSVAGITNVRPLIVNATNRKTLRKLFGEVSAKTLEGCKIQLYIDHNVRDPQDGGKIDGIRIRPFMPKLKTYQCADCKQVISDFQGKTAEFLAGYTQKSYGRPLCADCAAKAKQAAEVLKMEGDDFEDNEN